MQVSKLIGGVVAGVVLVAPAVAGAQAPSPIVVNSTGDWVVQPSDVQACTTGADTCILRAAVYAASQGTGGGTIQFAPSVTGTIALSQGSLEVFGNTSIVGPGAGVLAIDGSANTNAGIIEDAADSLSISGLTLQNGTASWGLLSDLGGGAIQQQEGDLAVSNVTFDGNSSGSGNDGGAIYAGGDATTITSSSFTNNATSTGASIVGDGGAIALESGTLTVTDSAFVANSVQFKGGAIAADGGGAVSITGSTFTGNTSISSGGAVHGDSGPLTITTSTFTANQSANDGSAVDAGSGVVLSISGSHVTSNGYGGVAISAQGTLDLSNSLVENNVGIDESGLYAQTGYLTNVTITGNQVTNSDFGCSQPINALNPSGCIAGLFLIGGGALAGTTVTGNTLPAGANGHPNCWFGGPVVDQGGNTLGSDCPPLTAG